jgi:hypothetical protein
MNIKASEIVVNGVPYVPKGSEAASPAADLNGMPYRIVRTYSAGVFAAYVEKREGKEATLRQARRLWYWDGANSLSDLAVNGTTKPGGCKFPVAVDSVEVTEVIEVLSVTEKARASINGVPEWKQ